MDIKVTLKSGRSYQFKVSVIDKDKDKFMHGVFKGKSVRFGNMIINTNEIETIEIE